MEYKAWYNKKTSQFELLFVPKNNQFELVIYEDAKLIYQASHMSKSGALKIDLVGDPSSFFFELDGRRIMINYCYGRSPIYRLKGVSDVAVTAYQFVVNRVIAEVIGELSVI